MAAVKHNYSLHYGEKVSETGIDKVIAKPPVTCCHAKSSQAKRWRYRGSSHQIEKRCKEVDSEPDLAVETVQRVKQPRGGDHGTQSSSDVVTARNQEYELRRESRVTRVDALNLFDAFNDAVYALAG